MKITLVISSLYSGGAERVVVLLAKGFIDKGHEVTVITLSGKELDFFNLPDKANRLALGLFNNSSNVFEAIRANLHRLEILRKAIISTKPDIVISHLTATNILTILCMLRTPYPVIVTEHTDPKKFFYTKSWKILRRLTYPFADNIVSVSQGVNDAFHWLPQNKKSVIYNPILEINSQQENIDLPIDLDPAKEWIISMGRLRPEKGFDILLSAFSKIAHLHLNWQLVILGKGELKTDIEKMAKDLSLTSRVILTGAIKNPFPLLKKSSLFVMSSRSEAFPMALCEAMATGLPVIATDCCSGSREIIRDGIDGVIVPSEDISALARAMNNLMSDEKERQRLSNRAPEVTERFSIEKVMEDWLTVIKKII